MSEMACLQKLRVQPARLNTSVTCFGSTVLLEYLLTGPSCVH